MGLPKISAIDLMQIRGLDAQRFVRRLGSRSQAKMEEAVLALADILECP
jgi:mRNA interferase MazF